MYLKVIYPALVTALLVASVTPSMAANDGSIEISGRLVATTCNVEGKPPGSGGVSKPVALDGIATSKLATVGQTAGDRGFAIVIGGNEDCTDGLKAKLRFDPASPALDRTTGRLKVDPVAGAATNVQIEIANGDGTPIHLYTDDSMAVEVAGHTAKVELLARYYSLGAATQGPANSRVGFQVVYD